MECWVNADKEEIICEEAKGRMSKKSTVLKKRESCWLYITQRKEDYSGSS